jgi:hypothetical protein
MLKLKLSVADAPRQIDVVPDIFPFGNGRVVNNLVVDVIEQGELPKAVKVSITTLSATLGVYMGFNELELVKVPVPFVVQFKLL